MESPSQQSSKQRTVKTHISVTIKWDIQTSMYWDKDMKPPEDRVTDVLADTALGSALTIESISANVPEWDEPEEEWVITGTVTTVFTETLTRPSDEVEIDELLQRFEWIQDASLHSVTDYVVTDLSCEEVVTTRTPISVTTADAFEERLKEN